MGLWALGSHIYVITILESESRLSRSPKCWFLPRAVLGSSLGGQGRPLSLSLSPGTAFPRAGSYSLCLSIPFALSTIFNQKRVTYRDPCGKTFLISKHDDPTEILLPLQTPRKLSVPSACCSSPVACCFSPRGNSPRAPALQVKTLDILN